jgi:hypothetical protein
MHADIEKYRHHSDDRNVSEDKKEEFTQLDSHRNTAKAGS